MDTKEGGTYQRQDTALSSLSESRTDLLEVGSVGGDGHGVGAGEVRDAEHISCAALCGGVEATAWCVDLACLLEGRGGGDAQEESGGGEGELHFEIVMWFLCVCVFDLWSCDL